MAKRKTARSFFEPWIATKSVSHGEMPVTDGIPEEAADKIADAWQRSDDNADRIIWGSNMAHPCVAKGFMSGKPVILDDRRIIAVRRTLGLPEKSPDHEAVARRIADCVNACAGIGDPESFVSEVRALLLEYIQGEGQDPREDPRVTSLLGRCIPPEQHEELTHAGREDER